MAAHTGQQKSAEITTLADAIERILELERRLDDQANEVRTRSLVIVDSQQRIVGTFDTVRLDSDEYEAACLTLYDDEGEVVVTATSSADKWGRKGSLCAAGIFTNDGPLA